MEPNPGASMPPTKQDLNSRVLQLAELLQIGWQIIKNNWQNLLLLTLIISVPMNIVGEIINRVINNANTDNLGNLFLGFSIGGLAVSAVVLSLAGILIPLGVAAIVMADLGGTKIDYQNALKQAFGRWGAGIKTSLLMVVCLIPLAIALVVPAIIFGVFWAFSIYLVMTENLSGWAALKRSKTVVQGRWWKVFGNLIAFSILASIAAWILQVVFSFLPNGAVSNVIFATINSVTTIFAIVAGFALFKNLTANQK
ncbi:hypothetical protein C4546_02450 [Candidatus Parcubacteria bacterium]|jgi:hypothetical protein|nr:MAG: hypothetical protein C4546_02450 [Candidatus Parcubacteria bacterium]